MKKKKILASLVLASAALSLAACGGGETPTSQPSKTSPSTPSATKIGRAHV